MKFLLALCSVACLIAALHAAAVDTTTAQPKTADVDDASSTTVVPTTAANVIEECHQPKETGRCFALFYRFAYNVENRQCEEFIYGGCNGNQNNFDSKEECEKKCLPKADAADKAEESTTTAKASDEAQPEVPNVGELPSVAA